VRGRIDHKERGETKLVVQEAERFEPGAGEIASAAAARIAPSEPVKLTIDAAELDRPGVIDQMKEVFEHHKGEAEVHLAICNGEGKPTVVKLGNRYRVRASSGLRAELGHVLGPKALAA